jgi:hypothetical protein
LKYVFISGVCLWATLATAQLHNSARPQGDLTLFGDPSCAFWLQVDPQAKLVWLRAILSPINMGYLQREKPAKNKFSELPSLTPAVEYVDHFCAASKESKAMAGALAYFAQLTSTPTR